MIETKDHAEFERLAIQILFFSISYLITAQVTGCYTFESIQNMVSLEQQELLQHRRTAAPYRRRLSPTSRSRASCSTALPPPRRQEIYREVSQARAAKVDAIFIAGGPHPSAMPEEVLEHFDFVVIGEGEETLPELIEAI